MVHGEVRREGQGRLRPNGSVNAFHPAPWAAATEEVPGIRVEASSEASAAYGYFHSASAAAVAAAKTRMASLAGNGSSVAAQAVHAAAATLARSPVGMSGGPAAVPPSIPRAPRSPKVLAVSNSSVRVGWSPSELVSDGLTGAVHGWELQIRPAGTRNQQSKAGAVEEGWVLVNDEAHLSGALAVMGTSTNALEAPSRGPRERAKLLDILAASAMDTEGKQ